MVNGWVTVREIESERDFSSPFVSGQRADRRLGLQWYRRFPDGRVENFRPAGSCTSPRSILLSIDRALQSGRPLVGRVVLTDEHELAALCPTSIRQRLHGRSGTRD